MNPTRITDRFVLYRKIPQGLKRMGQAYEGSVLRPRDLSSSVQSQNWLV